MDNVALVDLAVARVQEVTADVAVNTHHHRGQMEEHLAGRTHLSVEEPEALGTAGALGQLREWIDGRPAVVVNGDGWTRARLPPLVEGWDGERVRLLLAGGGPFGPRSRPVAALMPWRVTARLEPVPSGLYEYAWRPEDGAGRLEVIDYDGELIDCGTPRDYLAANLASSGGTSVIGEGAVVEGFVERSVIWPGAIVRAEEVLVDAIRVDDRMTVLVR